MSQGSRAKKVLNISTGMGRVKPADMERLLSNEVDNGYIEKRIEEIAMSNVEKNANIVKTYSGSLLSAMREFQENERHIATSVKKSSGSIRDSAEKLKNGLEKVQKAADFEKLESMADTLERISKSLSTLAELEDSGKLNKIIKSVQ